MMKNHTYTQRLFAFLLSVSVAAGTLGIVASPAMADDDQTPEATQTSTPASDGQDTAGSSQPDTQDKAEGTAGDKQDKASTPDNKKDKAASDDDKDKAADTYTLNLSDGLEDTAVVKMVDHGDGTRTVLGKKEALFSEFFEGSTSGLAFSVDPAGNVSYNSEDGFVVTGTFNGRVTITFNRPDDTELYKVYITCTKGAPWPGETKAEGEAYYGQGDDVDLTNCLPDNWKDTVTFGTPSVDDPDSVLNGSPSIDQQTGKLSFEFVDDDSKVGKTAEVIIPVTKVKDDEYSPYKIVVKLTVLDKKTQTVSAENVEGTEGDADKKISAETTGDGTLTYEVVEGEDYVEVDKETGALTLKQEGEATVRVTASETDEYKEATKDVTVTVHAKPTYSVLVSDDGHGMAVATPGAAAQGTTIKLSATPDEGYEFDSWTVVSGDVTIKDDSFEMPENDVEVKANFKKASDKPQTRSITFKANGGTGTMSKQTAEKGSTITLNANKFKRTGYTFTGWNTKQDGSGTTFKDKAKVKLNANATLYAQWKKNSSSNNSSSSSSSKKSSSSSSSSGSSSSSLAETGDPTNTGLIAALAIGGGVLMGAGYVASKKRGKDDDAAEAEAEAGAESE